GVSQDLASIPQFDPAKEEAGAPQINRNGVMATMPMLIGLAALGGKVAGVHPKIMLGAVNGMTKGLIQGNEKAYQDAKQKYDDAYQRYMDKYKQQMAIYKEMQQVYKGQVNADLKALEISLRATGYQGKVDQETLKAWQWTQDHSVKLEKAESDRQIAEARVRELDARAAKENRTTPGGAKPAATAKSIDEADAQIDDIIQQLQNHPSSAGLIGYGKRFAETIGSAAGISDDAPAHQLQTSMEALLLQLPKLLTNTSKSSKDERARVDSIANALKVGVTAPIAIQKLQQLKQILAEKRSEVSSDSPADKFVVGKAYKDAKGNTAIYKGNGQWQAQ
ncbi:MAG TPA: hypothetical protein VJQ82_25880, partial [Terriglobales bacterium]|nr:hypothetical protein [Terriglobales bacterium]